MSEHEIEVISTSTIKIKIKSTTTQINLTPWDLELLFLEYSQKGLLFLNPTPLQKSDHTSLIHHLKASLTSALHFFPPLAGRLATAASHDGAATCFSIDCNEGGALFVHATIKDQNKLTVADILSPIQNEGALNSNHVPEIVRSFFPLNGVRNYDGVSLPLLAVQVTELVDGLFIGCSINHLVVDGTSFWHFFNSWAEISRGNETITKLPFLNRDQINLDLIASSRIYISNQHLDYNKNTNLTSMLSDGVFYLSKQSVAKLKERANFEAKGKKVISSLQAVIAHVWTSIIRCRSVTSADADETTSFEIPMGARRRLDPPLPEEYFGNAVFPGVSTLGSGDLVSNGPGWAAGQINGMLASNNGPDKVREFCMGWIKSPEFLQFEGLPKNHFILINSPRFDVYGNDFGWGKPVAVRSGRANGFDGRITVSGGLEEGSMEIEACLTPETLSKLTEDAQFMEFVTSKQ